MITFRKLSSPDPAVDYITQALTAKLSKGKRVLWLLSGGSAIGVATAVADKLAGQNLEKLAVTLTDERYGDLGHTDSNWRQLADAGFKLPGARMRPVLTSASFDATVINFAEILEEELDRADYRIGLFGIGPDGHTAGILPGSPAVEADDLTEGFEWTDYQRITMTPSAIECLDEAVVYAVGEAKWPTLDKLDEDVDVDEQPAQALKSVPLVTIFNDHKGDES
jgi:6-phosphogluconolactonase/glucosamine-6-phosphate isomerase/deaminase